ncbi:phage tail domain-containing protein [Actinokineospora enzanensis]|uniref:phage tail domain-containing protein n=1 Tax=Actinokineospora enzanensis TaxID=155975 RepID=UPI00036717B0|nr:phage tail domain-containing protein [Actinokineospora enzanensis]
MARELRWYPGDGSDPLVLTDPAAGYKVLKGSTGWGAAPVEHVTESTPLVDGEEILETYETGRTILLPMLITGRTYEAFQERLGALVDAMDPRVPGQLEIAQPNGQRRRIAAVYAEGLEGAEDKDSGGDTTWHKAVIRLYCPDPAFFDPTPVRLMFGYPAPVSFFPLFPLRLSADAVLGAATIINPGDLPAWPQWTATAPGTGAQFDNEDTGEELHVSGTLTDTLTIVTRPGIQAVTMGSADWWDRLVDVPQLWALPKGQTNVTVALTGAAPGSSVMVEFRPRYRKAW